MKSSTFETGLTQLVDDPNGTNLKPTNETQQSPMRDADRKYNTYNYKTIQTSITAMETVPCLSFVTWTVAH